VIRKLKIIDFFRDIFNGKDTVNLSESTETKKFKLQLERFLIEMAVNMLAGLIAKCEFKTYIKNEEVKQDEYYLWNVEPNYNQNSSQFLQELISKLLKNNEALVILENNQLLIADSFTRTPYALYPDTFSNINCRNFSFGKSYSMQDVMYFKLNDENIKALLSNTLSGYSELLDMAFGKYKRAGGRKGTVKLDKPKTGDKEKDKEIDDLFNRKFKQYFQNENAVINLPKGVDYTEIAGEGSKKSTSEIGDIVNITKEIVSRVAQAFRMPPALLQGDIADTSKVIDQLLTFGLDPILDLVETEINRKRYGKIAYLNGSFIKVDTTCIKHIDIFDVAVQADKLISDGLYSVDELRTKLGDMALNTWWSQGHWMTKNYDKIENLKGGETGGESNVGN
jgi:HK97 family phage portal protein